MKIPLQLVLCSFCVYGADQSPRQSLLGWYPYLFLSEEKKLSQGIFPNGFSEEMLSVEWQLRISVRHQELVAGFARFWCRFSSLADFPGEPSAAASQASWARWPGCLQIQQ